MLDMFFLLENKIRLIAVNIYTKLIMRAVLVYQLKNLTLFFSYSLFLIDTFLFWYISVFLIIPLPYCVLSFAHWVYLVTSVLLACTRVQAPTQRIRRIQELVSQNIRSMATQLWKNSVTYNATDEGTFANSNRKIFITLVSVWHLSSARFSSCKLTYWDYVSGSFCQPIIFIS